MFSISCQYAIRAVLFLAVNTSEQSKIGADHMAEALNIPKHFLAKILQQLTKINLVSSSKGRNGGFYLSDENKESNLLQVIYAIDGPEKFSNCILGLKACSEVTPCPYHDFAVDFREEFHHKLGSESIFETANRISEENLTLKI